MILDLGGLNHTFRTYNFKMLSIKLIVSHVQFEVKFVTIDLKDAFCFRNSEAVTFQFCYFESEKSHAPRATCASTLEQARVQQASTGPWHMLSSQVSNDGCLSHRLECGSRWLTSPWAFGGTLISEGRFSSSGTLPSTAEGLACVCPYRQHYGNLLHQSPGWAALGRRKVPFSESILHSGDINVGADIQ